MNLEVISSIWGKTVILSLGYAFIIWLIVRVCVLFLKKLSHVYAVKLIGLLFFLFWVFASLFVDAVNISSPINGQELDISARYFISGMDWLMGISPKQLFFINFIWVLGVFIGIIKLTVSAQLLNKLKKSSSLINNKELVQMFQSLKEKLNLSIEISLATSPLIKSPLTFGFIKPVILLPISAITYLTTDELEMIILHELWHIKRKDYLLNIFLVAVETLFFFNPFIHLLLSDIRKEMEYSCDDHVLKVTTKSSLSYVKTLMKLQEKLILTNTLAIGFNKSKGAFKSRIERIINPDFHKKKQNRWGVSMVLILCVLFFYSTKTSHNTIEHQPIKKERVQIKVKAEREEKTTPLTNNKIVPKHPEVKMYGNPNQFQAEVNKELIRDGILNSNRTSIKLLFQYSDVLNGKSALKDKYEKYKKILNKHFPRYDSFAGTIVFRLQ